MVVAEQQPRDVLDEIRWSFTLPMTWLQGVGANLVLSFLWLLVAPLTGRPQEDWVIVVGSYFATFELADVTTTSFPGRGLQLRERYMSARD